MRRFLVFIVTGLFFLSVQAASRIAILDFELNDLTLAPGIPKELQRTASLKGLLEGELSRAGYAIVKIDSQIQQQANAGFGYLFEHSDLAAELAKPVNADYILVGRLHKPSFLFAYILGHLVRVSDGRLIGNYIIETKGGEQKLSHKAIESLTVKIDQDLDKRYTLPKPEQGINF